MKYYMEVYNGTEWKRSTLESAEDWYVAGKVKQYNTGGIYARMVNADNVRVDPDDYDGTNVVARHTPQYQLGWQEGWDAALKWAFPG